MTVGREERLKDPQISHPKAHIIGEGAVQKYNLCLSQRLWGERSACPKLLGHAFKTEERPTPETFSILLEPAQREGWLRIPTNPISSPYSPAGNWELKPLGTILLGSSPAQGLLEWRRAGQEQTILLLSTSSFQGACIGKHPSGSCPSCLL